MLSMVNINCDCTRQSISKCYQWLQHQRGLYKNVINSKKTEERLEQYRLLFPQRELPTITNERSS